MKRYTPDFPEMMRLCETNFAQLRRLLPRTDAAGETVSYQVGNAQYRLTIVESTRYTTLVAIEQTAPSVSYWSLPSMTVRLYHDAMVSGRLAALLFSTWSDGDSGLLASLNLRTPFGKPVKPTSGW